MVGWEAVSAAYIAARAQVAAVAPDAQTAAEGEAYVTRVLTTCLNDAFLGHLLTENGLSRALPTRGGPNPDYRMVHAGLDPTRRYRLEGRLNASERVGVGLYSFGAGGSANLAGYAAFDAGTVDAQGRFAVDVAADADGPGALTITPDTRVIMMRTLHRDADGEPAGLVLKGAEPTSDLALAGGSTAAALAHVAQALRASVTTFLEWTAATAGSPNAFLAEEPTLTQGMQGDPDTIYFLGGYRLEPAEWLEVVMPAGLPGYWSLHAYNHWCESLPGAGIGDDRCIAEPDGRIRIAIGPDVSQASDTIAGMPRNRIDTRGRSRGALICRIIGAGEVAVPETVLHRSGERD